MGRVLALRPQPARDAVDPGEDPALVERCRAGDRQALDAVLGAHADAVERLIARLVSPMEVEDLLHNTFVAAITAFPAFRGEARVRTWLSRIAVRVAVDWLRSPARARRAALDVEPVSEGDARADDAADARRQLARLHELLDELSPLRRVAFVMHVLEGRSIDEVAALTGASIVATKSRIFWARRHMLRRAKKDPLLRERARGAS
jgi:RNA polymerase sigma-70 factor (ECF subfamily)